MVTSEGRMSSSPYTKKKGVSPIAQLGDVRLSHSTHGSSSIHFFAMLLQAITGASLETLEDFYIGPLNLTIALWVINRCIADLDAKIFTVVLEHATGKLGPVISDDSVRDPKPADNTLDKLDCGLLVDLDHGGCFRPLGEFVDGDVEISVPFDGHGERSHDVQPPHGEWP
jgi:hypothetical protein